jgi:hypothetical protein
MSQNVYILDIEADALYPYQKNVWVIYIRRLGGDELMIKPETFQGDIKDAILGFIFREPNPIIVAHNGLGYDFWVLWKEYGLEISCGPDKICGQPCTFFDTLYASQYLLPDRIGGHSLESWGIRVGNHKIDFREKCIELGIIPADAEKGDEFKQYTYLMDEYCIQDVAVTSDVFVALWTQLLEERTYNAFRLGQKSFFLMAAQGFTGVKFDIEEALRLKPMIEEVMNEIKSLVDPNLPQRPLKKSEEAHYKIPAKPFKQNGDLSATFVKWLEKHDAIFDGVSIIAYGNKFEFIPNCILPVSLPMSINDQKELKQFFLDSGWEPTMYNYKKDKKGKPIRDDYGQLIETSPKIQEAGVICPNLLELDGEIPKSVVKYLSYKNRLSTLKGWLKNDRLKFDGRLTSGNSGIASTHRQKHTVVVNVPKAEDGVILGKEFRGLFMVDEGNTMVGCDQAALEARVQGHWTFKYDNGVTAKRLLDGDPHSVNCKAFYPEETKDFDIEAEDFDSSHPKFKPYRSKSKNGGYAIMYGCSAGKLAGTLGKPVSLGTTLLEAFWKANQGLKDLKDAVESYWENRGDGRWIPGIDGRRLHSRSKHSLINLLFQSTGAIIVDYSTVLFDHYLGGLSIDELGRPYYPYKSKKVKRILYFHDEFQAECPIEYGQEIGELMERCMSEAGERLKLSIPLTGNSAIGPTWRDTH